MSAANVFNLGADIGAMGASLALIVPANVNVLTVTFGIISLIAVLFIPYSTYARYLKWLTLSLFSYVGVVFLVHVSWPAVLRATLIPHVALNKEFLMAIVAVLGTTISPYLFFWQASQEVEEVKGQPGRKSSETGSGPSDRAVGSDPYGYVCWHGIFKCGRLFYHPDRGLDIAHPRNHGCGDMRAGGSCSEAHRRSFRNRAVRVRDRGHGNASRAGIGGIGGLWDRGGVSMAREPRTAAASGSWLL